MEPLTHGSLFSGIGGFELGAKWAGIPTIWNCEIEEQNRKWLKANFPNAKQYDDIRTMENPPYVDIISGGFPCQDISIANQNGKGINGARSSLWSEYGRIIGEISPRFIIAENSNQLNKKGLEKILCDLADLGYNAEWQSLSGHFFGVQQGRKRLYLIAYRPETKCKGDGTQQIFRIDQLQEQFKRVSPGWARRSDIPEPRTLSRLDGISKRMVEAYGNAVMPRAAWYLFECIKRFYNVDKS